MPRELKKNCCWAEAEARAQVTGIKCTDSGSIWNLYFSPRKHVVFVIPKYIFLNTTRSRMSLGNIKFSFRCQCVPATGPVFLSTGTAGLTGRQSSTRHVQAPSGAYSFNCTWPNVVAPHENCMLTETYNRTALQESSKTYNAPMGRRANTLCHNNAQSIPNRQSSQTKKTKICNEY